MNAEQAFLLTWLTAAVRLAGPVLTAALGEIYCERAGVLNIGIEGVILLGALSSYLVTLDAGSLVLGFLAGGLAGALLGLLLSLFYVRLMANQVVVGIVFNILAAGTASYGYALIMGHGASPTVPMFTSLPIPWLSDLPGLGPVFFRQPAPLYLTLALVATAHYALFRTRFGLNLRAAGENPRAAQAAGISVPRMRTIGVSLSGAAAGLAGGYLVTAQIGLFRDNIVNGQGFIALAIVIFGRWSPVKAMLAAFVFGAADALQLSLQLFQSRIPAQALLALPYALTVLAMSGVLGRTVQPGALTQPFHRE
jgi:ABC-type uncharacterized transport system permease subunit